MKGEAEAVSQFRVCILQRLRKREMEAEKLIPFRIRTRTASEDTFGMPWHDDVWSKFKNMTMSLACSNTWCHFSVHVISYFSSGDPLFEVCGGDLPNGFLLCQGSVFPSVFAIWHRMIHTRYVLFVLERNMCILFSREHNVQIMGAFQQSSVHACPFSQGN